MKRDLRSVRVLYRDRNLQLWGIPYDLRPGQSPRDLFDSRTEPVLGTHYGQARSAPGPRADWIWLGAPGWYSTMSPGERNETKAFLAGLDVPKNAHEWTRVHRENPERRGTARAEAIRALGWWRETPWDRHAYPTWQIVEMAREDARPSPIYAELRDEARMDEQNPAGAPDLGPLFVFGALGLGALAVWLIGRRTTSAIADAKKKALSYAKPAPQGTTVIGSLPPPGVPLIFADALTSGPLSKLAQIDQAKKDAQGKHNADLAAGQAQVGGASPGSKLSAEAVTSPRLGNLGKVFENAPAPYILVLYTVRYVAASGSWGQYDTPKSFNGHFTEKSEFLKHDLYTSPDDDLVQYLDALGLTNPTMGFWIAYPVPLLEGGQYGAPGAWISGRFGDLHGLNASLPFFAHDALVTEYAYSQTDSGALIAAELKLA